MFRDQSGELVCWSWGCLSSPSATRSNSYLARNASNKQIKTKTKTKPNSTILIVFSDFFQPWKTCFQISIIFWQEFRTLWHIKYWSGQDRKQFLCYVAICPQGGYSRFQVAGMIEWQQKSTPKKIPWAKFNPWKFPCWISILILWYFDTVELQKMFGKIKVF